MALSRKFLSALGIEPEKIDEIIEAHADTVNALKAERDDAKTSAGKAEALEKELSEVKAQLEASGKDEYKAKYEALQKEYDSYKADQEAKITAQAKDLAYRSLLKGAGVSEKRIDAIMKVTNLSEIELDGDRIKDAEKLTESVKKEWSDFITTTNTEGAGTDTPPANEGGSTGAVSIPTIF